MTVESVLKKLLKDDFLKVSEFSLDFLKRNQKGDAEDNFIYLCKLGMNPSKMVKHIHLLGLEKDILASNYNNLKSLGLSKEKIVSRPSLLGFNQKTIMKHFQNLRNLDISPKKIASRAELLEMNPKTIQEHYEKFKTKEIPTPICLQPVPNQIIDFLR